MLQRLIGVSIGALVTFVLLLLFYGGIDTAGAVSWRIVGDSTQAFLVAPSWARWHRSSGPS